MAEQEYNFPVFGTQGGGLVSEVDIGKYVFVEPPDPIMNLGVGDPMPEEWGITPANDRARRVFDRDDLDD